ncbi:MAG TPA: hypothetical protein VL068_10555 [Microthrixaceae bacterium]|nr:hypothetical protein [Microthrixaceae bacterium]
MSSGNSGDRISPQDIKAKLSDIQGGALDQVEGAKNQLVTIGAALALGLVIGAFLLGRRGGKRSSAIIEVRRG